MGNSCTVPATCGSRFRDYCSVCFCCRCCHCDCCDEPKFGRSFDNAVVTTNPISTAKPISIVMAASDENDCKFRFYINVIY